LCAATRRHDCRLLLLLLEMDWKLILLPENTFAGSSSGVLLKSASRVCSGS
jgi:hypothetical protein